MEIIINFLEGKINKETFFNTLYEDSELENILTKEQDVPPYTNRFSLYEYLISGDVSNIDFIVDAKDSLEKFLLKKKITVTLDDKESEIQNILLTSIPKWLDVESAYFNDIIKNYNGKNKKETVNLIKEKIKREFIYLKTKPKWIQSPNWPIINGEPLIFIGEKDISSISHDTSKVYIFYNKNDNQFTCIKQSM